MDPIVHGLDSQTSVIWSSFSSSDSLLICMQRPTSSEEEHSARLAIDTRFSHHTGSTLFEDARIGLTSEPKALPPMHLYDAAGSRLFDAICNTPEYYPTRTEAALLEVVADEVMTSVRPAQLVELGSGASRKTRALLEAMHRVGGDRYAPLDVSESIVRQAAAGLLDAYSWLHIHGMVGDYAHTLAALPAGSPRLLAFLGGSIGNYTDEEAIPFLQQMRDVMEGEDALLLGADLVKDETILHAAYNDAQGLTAAFNKNLLKVLNRELDADFHLSAFEHVAFYDSQQARIEMHLRSKHRQTIRVEALDLDVDFSEGETLHTEISRKFTRGPIEHLLDAAGLRLERWFTPANGYFSLSLARRR